ncbi:DUF397 domain-containing protein [Streptomyces sp. NPDC049881]|uniref:DUF397 domain-containing protein n=1 Tax=Streptomyces sp. NPDC049881 TaxID=3155778 RepID=UPI00342A9D94
MTVDRAAPAECGGDWRKSSHSGSENGDCVELAFGFPGAAPVRDSKNPAATPVVFTSSAWREFIGALKESGAR